MKNFFVFLCMSIGLVTLGGFSADAAEDLKSVNIADSSLQRTTYVNPGRAVSLNGTYCGWENWQILTICNVKQTGYGRLRPGDKYFGRIKIYDFYANKWIDQGDNYHRFTPTRGKHYWVLFEAIFVRYGVEYVNATYTHSFDA